MVKKGKKRGNRNAAQVTNATPTEDDIDLNDTPPSTTQKAAPPSVNVLAMDSDDSDSDEDRAPPPPSSKAKAAASALALDSDSDDDESEDEPAPPPSKKSNSNKFSAAASALALDDSDEDDDEEDESTPPPSPPKSKKAQKKAKKAAQMAAALALDDDSDDSDEADNESDAEAAPPAVKIPEPEPEPVAAAQTSKKGKKNKKKNKKAAAAAPADDDFDALLADVAGTPVATKEDAVDALADAIESAAPEKKLTKAQLKRKKQKEKKAKEAAAAAAAASGEAKDSSEAKPADAEKGGDAIDSLLADIDAAEPEQKLSKAQQKRLRKKQAEEAKAKAAAAAADGGDTPAADAAGAEEAPTAAAAEAEEEETSGKKKRRKKKKGKGAAAADDSKKAAKPMSAIARRAQEAKRLRDQMEAELRAAEEERLRLIREEEERVKREEEERQRKIEEKKKKRKENIEKARADGTYMTAAQKKKAAAAAQARAQLEAMGVVPGNKAKGGKKKPVYSKKKKGGKKFGGDKLFEQQQKELEEAKKRQAEEEDDEDDEDDEDEEEEEVAVEEPVAAKEEPEGEDEEEDDDDDWDADSDDEAAKPKKKAPAKKAATSSKKLSAYGDDDDWDASSGDEAEASPAAKPSGADSDDWDAESDDEEQKPKWTPKAKTKKQPAPAAAKKSQPAAKAKQASPKSVKSGDSKSTNGSAKSAKTNGAADPLMMAKPKKGGKKGKKGKNKKEKVDVVSKTKAAKMKNRDLRSPICCVLGHVDTGKTKLLDKIRKSSVQDHEEGGITQQIGATFFPMDRIKAQTAEVNALQKRKLKYHLPGLLIIDTPGHESFSNLRKRGANLCDIAVLVVDIMHGLEPQTRESIQILTRQNVPFVVALNKIDRIYDWKPTPNAAFQTTIANQGEAQKNEFERRLNEITLQFNEIGHNCALYTKVRDINDTVALVPTSAHTGEGIPDMLMLLVQMTQHMMADQLQYLGTPEATVLEVKVTEGLGHTIDVILSNGTLRCNDKIILCGMNGPIVTHIKALLVPAPLKEIRVKGDYLRLQEVKASMGIRISAGNLDQTIAGTSMLVCGPRDNEDMMMDEVMADYADVQARITKHNKRGVFVQSSTLGALEALLDYLTDQEIPVMGVALGPVHKKQVMSAATMLSHQKEYAAILAFNVKIDRDAQDYADREGVKIFAREIIYNLTDDFTAYLEKIKSERRAASSDKAVFPVILEIKSAAHVFHNHNPIIVGCIVKQGILKIGTPLCAMFDKEDKTAQQYVEIGTVDSLEKDNKQVEVAMPGDELAVKITQNQMQHHIYYGRQFTVANPLCSVLTRESVDVLKVHFKADIIDNDLVGLIGRLGVFFGFIQKKRAAA